ncbi:MAG: TetR/AcrR family transcriptional regulator [Clostridiales bacterium]|nr:TetR/AcrR family transcriptional regulator [Clostridiales bacterium]
MTKHERLTEFNRGNILSAAKSLFEANGFSRTTMDNIADKADCSKSTLYSYFVSKEEIYNHILFDRMVLLRDRFRSAIRKKAGFEEAYNAVCRTLTDFQREYPLYFGGILGEIGMDEGEFEKQPVLRDIYVVGEEINVILSEMIMNGVESGFLRSDLDPILSVYTLWASLCGIIKTAEQKDQYFRDKLRLTKQKFRDYGFRMLLNALRA